MRTLSPTSEAERVKLAQDVIWLMEIDWPDQTRRYATRPVTIGGDAFEGSIVDPGEMVLALSSAYPLAAGVKDRATVTLSNRAEDDPRFEALCLAHDPEGLACRVGMLFLSVSGQPAREDIILFQRFIIEGAQFDNLTVQLQLSSRLLRQGERRATRVIAEALAPQLSPEAVGQALPLCFGEIDRSPLVPLRVGARARLAGTLRAGDTVAAVTSLDGFAASGWAQIGGEALRYLAVDAGAKTLGRPDTPLVRPAAAFHPSGAVVAAIPDGGFQYAVADHECLEVGPVYQASAELPPASYTAGVEVMGGAPVAKVSFPLLPVVRKASAQHDNLLLDGVAFGGDWAAAADNTAQSPLSALAGDDMGAYATIAGDEGALSLEFRGDLSGGGSQYGAIRSARLKAQIWASGRWASQTGVSLFLGRGAASAQTPQPRPLPGEGEVVFGPHSHDDTIRDAITDSRALFQGGEVMEAIEFDNVIGPTGGHVMNGWAYPEKIIDGLAFTSTGNNIDPSLDPAPVKLSRTRPFLRDQDVTLTSVTMCVRAQGMTHLGSPSVAILAATINGVPYARYGSPVPDTEPATVRMELNVAGLKPSDVSSLTSYFSITTARGWRLDIFEAWLEVRYQQNFAGRSQQLGQTRTGQVLPAGELRMTFPTRPVSRSWDVTGFVQEQGGWGFFSLAGGAWPGLGVRKSGHDDPVEIYVSQLCMEIEYETESDEIAEDDLSAHVKGWAPDGRLLESPGEVIATLLRHPRFMGLGESEVDEASLAAAPGYWFARRVAGAETLNDLVLSAAREARCRLMEEGGVARLAPSPADFIGASAAFVFDAGNTLNAAMPRERSSSDDVVNALTLLCNQDYCEAASAKKAIYRTVYEAQDAGSQLMPWGRRELEWPLAWHQHGRLDDLANLAAYTLERLAYRRMIARAQTPPVAAHLERGDVVRIDYGGTAPGETYGEVVEIRGGAMKSFEIAVSATPALLDMWRADAGTRVIVRAGKSRLYFLLEGERIASLDRAGIWRLRGEVIENGLDGEAMDAAIIHDSEGRRMLFGGLGQGAFQSLFALDADGNLLVRGGLVERADLSGQSLNGFYEAAQGRFSLAVDGGHPVVVCDAATGRLSLTGEAVEGAAWV